MSVKSRKYLCDHQPNLLATRNIALDITKEGLTSKRACKMKFLAFEYLRTSLKINLPAKRKKQGLELVKDDGSWVILSGC